MVRSALIGIAMGVGLALDPATAEVVITIDKASQAMAVSVDGQPRYHWPVSTGRHGYDTPNGSHQAFRMEEDHFSKEWDDAPMPHSIFFTPKGHAIHGSYEVKRLGMPASHGCVRLHPENAAKLFALVRQVGVLKTTVVISGALPPPGAPMVAQRPLSIAPAGHGGWFASRPFGSDFSAQRYERFEPSGGERRAYPPPQQGWPFNMR